MSLLRLTFYPEIEPYTSFKLIDEDTGEIILIGDAPTTEEIIRTACEKYRQQQRNLAALLQVPLSL
jgi:hypothetical protein